VDGNNLIGIFAGDKWGTSEDKIILVVAHWDTVTNSPGYDDNGSGVAALLEIARALSEAQCKPEFTIILAAVDLEEVGTQGAIPFVHDFLIERILKPFNFPGVQVYMKVERL
jgi:Zn-dependent M28 family amino/carboxypeptidase